MKKTKHPYFSPLSDNTLSFADPLDPLATALDVDQTFFNVGWGGVRSSSLPYAIEPINGTLDYGSSSDINNVNFLDLCPWGTEGEVGIIRDLHELGGYTTFVTDRLLVNQSFPSIETWCRKGTGEFLFLALYNSSFCAYLI